MSGTNDLSHEEKRELSPAEKQEALQTDVNNVNSRLDEMAKIISNAVVVEQKEEESTDEAPADLIIKLTKSDYDKLVDEMTKLTSIAKDLVSGITELKRSIETQDAKIATVEHKMLMKNNDLDQHFRLHNSIFHNMQGTGEGSKYCQDIANQLNYMLPHLSTPVSIHNIDIAHPLKNNSKNQPVVIVRFVNIDTYVMKFWKRKIKPL